MSAPTTPAWVADERYVRLRAEVGRVRRVAQAQIDDPAYDRQLIAEEMLRRLGALEADGYLPQSDAEPTTNTNRGVQG